MSKKREQLLEELYQCVLADEKYRKKIWKHIRSFSLLNHDDWTKRAAEDRTEGRRIRRWRLRLLRELKEVVDPHIVCDETQ